MLSRRWNLLGFCVLCLMVLSMAASAAVTDPNIITGVVRYNPDGNSGDTVPAIAQGGLMEGALPFVDRTYPCGDANDLAGLDYIQTCVDDKDNPNHQMDVTVDKAGTLYIIIDNRVGDDNENDPPTLGDGVMDWVNANGFIVTSRGVNISTPGTVYALPLAGAGTTTLYQQDDGGGRVMYVVAAAPAGWNLLPEVTGIPASAQVAPGKTLVIDSTVADDGIPGTGISVNWTTISAPDGATVDYSPDATSEDVEISFSELGEYTLQFIADDGEKMTSKTIQVSVQTPTFAVEATNWVEAVNDTKNGGSTAHYKPTSYMYVRNHGAPRRRVQLISYDVSGLKEAGEAFANTFLTLRRKAGSSNKVLSVYGVNEDLDNFDLNSGSWSNLPGVANTPVPPMSDPLTLVSLDIADLSELLLEQTNIPAGSVWSNTATSAGLDEFLNADDDGTVLLLFVTFSPQDADFEIFARDRDTAEPETGLGGIIVRGNVLPETWASKPSPEINSEQIPSLSELSWTNPASAGTVTCNVYIGTGEPNLSEPDYGYDTLLTETTGNSVSLSGYELGIDVTYNWIVDVTDSDTGVTTMGYMWTFTVLGNLTPTVSIADPLQYLWLNNDGDPTTAKVVLDSTADDDGDIQPLTYSWELVSGPEVTIDSITAEDMTLALPEIGTYNFKVTVFDGEWTAFAAASIVVGATPCDAAQAKPEYTANIADFNNDCYVNLQDFNTFALSWLECNPAMDTFCAQ